MNCISEIEKDKDWNERGREAAAVLGLRKEWMREWI
jgi:hypothetical protein